MKIIVFTFDLLESLIVVFRKGCSRNLENSPVKWLCSEAATGDVLLKKVFLKSLQISHENTSVGVSL